MLVHCPRRPARLHRSRSIAAALIILAATFACAGQGRVGAERRNPQRIGSAEIEEMQRAGIRDLHELIARQRPAWLQTRNDRSLQLPTAILVYQNETRLGGIDALRGYPLDQVTSLRYLDAAQAGLLPGAGSVHVEGAIVITTGERPTPPAAATPPPHGEVAPRSRR